MRRKTDQLPGPGGDHAVTVTMLLLGDVTGDIRVIKTARTLQAMGLRVTVQCLAAQPSTRPLPNLGGAEVRWVGAGRPVSRALAALGALRGALRGRATQIEARAAAPPAVTGVRRSGLRGLRALRAFLGTLRLNLILAHAVPEPGAFVHAHDLDTLLAGVRLARRGGARLVYDAHELYPEMLPGASPLYAGLWRRLEHRLIGRADAVITVNDAIATELQRRHRLARRPTVVMNCPEVAPPAGTDGDLRRVRLLYHGAFTPGRGLEALVRAMARVDDRAHLVLRGDGPLREALQRLAREAGVAQRVLFVPPEPPDQLVAAMAGCSIGLVPYLPTSLNNYLCTPNKLFEYMMGGLAVIATDLPELRRIIARSDAGVLYAPADDTAVASAINALIRDPERLARCQAAARRAATTWYNWDAQATYLRQLYRQLGASL